MDQSLCAFDRSAGEKHRLAVDLVRRLWRERCGCLSIQVMQEFFVTATRKLNMPPEDAAAQIRRLGLWRVHRPSVEDVLAAADLHLKSQVSFWDAMILRSAQMTSCFALWSEDLSHGQHWGSVEVRNPFAALPPAPPR